MKIVCKAIVIALCVVALLVTTMPSLALFGPFGCGLGMSFPGFGFPGMGGLGGPVGYPGYYGYPGPAGYNAFGAGSDGLNVCINMPGIGSISMGQFGSGLGAVSF